jgi:hypothetical protein
MYQKEIQLGGKMRKSKLYSNNEKFSNIERRYHYINTSVKLKIIVNNKNKICIYVRNIWRKLKNREKLNSCNILYYQFECYSDIAFTYEC